MKVLIRPNVILYVVGHLLGAIILLFGFSALTSVSSLEVSDAVNSRVVRRPNYGLIFRYQQQIYAHSENYLHHLVFDLPDREDATARQFRAYSEQWQNIRNAPPKSPSEGNAFSEAFRKALCYEAFHIQQLVDTIYELVPAINFTTDGRNMRAVCAICGQARSLLEGTATTDQVEALNHVLQQ